MSDQIDELAEGRFVAYPPHEGNEAEVFLILEKLEGHGEGPKPHETLESSDRLLPVSTRVQGLLLEILATWCLEAACLGSPAGTCGCQRRLEALSVRLKLACQKLFQNLLKVPILLGLLDLRGVLRQVLGGILALLCLLHVAAHRPDEYVVPAFVT